MRPAAVGFQCPSCVREGSKSTRAGRTAYGGQRSGNPALTSQVLIGINVLVWLLILATGVRSSEWIPRLALRATSGLVRVNGQTFRLPDGVAEGAYWQVLTSMFTHVELWHIGFNMLALWVLGPQLELAIGRARFLALYLLSGLAGSATVLWLSAPVALTLGASGAIFGLMGGLLVVAIKVRGDVRTLLTWIGINFVITVLFVGNISWQGHLGGFVGGLLIGTAIVYAPREHRTAWQVAGIGAVALLVVLAMVTRVAVLA
jgi:membrane associated rhomboid family serine protease